MSYLSRDVGVLHIMGGSIAYRIPLIAFFCYAFFLSDFYLKSRLENMPRRSASRIGATYDPTEGRASTSSDPPRVRMKVGIARPLRRSVHATSSTVGRQWPTASEQRRKLRHDPLP